MGRRSLAYVEPGVSIDRRTRTAAEGLLMYVEAVPPAVNFRLGISVVDDERLVRLVLWASRASTWTPGSSLSSSAASPPTAGAG